MSNVEQKLEWREESPKHWVRSLDSIESFFYSASSIKTPSGMAHLMVRVGARLPLGIDCTIETIKEAWKTLRFYHPRIASSVVDGKLTYTIPSSQQLEEWLKATVYIDPVATSGLEVLATFKSLDTGVLIVLPTVREIIFEIPHCHIDGVGAMKFMNIILETLQAPPKKVTFGDEHRNLSNSITFKLGLQDPSKSDLHQAREIIRDFSVGLPGLGLNLKHNMNSSHAVRMEQVNFNPSESKRILKKSRSLGLSVTHVCHSSMIQAIHRFAETSSNTYSSLFFISLRERFQGRPGNPDSPVSLELTALPATIPTGRHQQSFERAKHLRNVYTKFKNDTEHVRLHQPIYDFLSQAPNTKTEAQVLLSSLGIVEDHVAQNLGDFWVGVSTATPDLTVYIWTFESRLTLSAWYNEAFHTKKEMSVFLQQMKLELISSLKIRSDLLYISHRCVKIISKACCIPHSFLKRQ